MRSARRAPLVYRIRHVAAAARGFWRARAGRGTKLGGLQRIARQCPNEAPLPPSAILNPIATLALVNQLEQQYGIQIDAPEAGIERFDTFRDIAALVARKRAASV